MPSADRPETRLAVRLSFLVAGFGVSCWAPLVPFAKQRLLVDDGVLGLLILSLGAGSVAAMLAAGPFSARFGSRPVVVAGGLGLATVLPTLALADTPLALGLALMSFGAALGSMDVAMNMQAVDVERAAMRPLMSGFHALFSVGGFAGAALMTLLLSIGLDPLAATIACSLPMAAAMAIAWPRLLASTERSGEPLFAAPRGIVLVLAALAAVTFLVEGAILDWSAILSIDAGHVTHSQGGAAYLLFSIAMTVGRLAGDGAVARIGDAATLVFGGIVASIGIAVALVFSNAAVALSGFVLIGLGAANIVPVLFRRAGSQKAMPPGLAIAAVTAAGYSGMLVGPAAIGLVADWVGLSFAFWVLAALLLVVPLGARAVTLPVR